MQHLQGMYRWLAIALVSTACGQATDASGSHGGQGDPPREPPERPRPADPAGFARSMHARFDELRTVERLLVAGDLDAARPHAIAIATAPRDAGTTRWADEIAQVEVAARAVAAATTVADALRGEPRFAAACARCHAATGSSPLFPQVPPLSPDAPAMARHQWAADRLWEGMIGAVDEPWTAGLAELARTRIVAAARDQQVFAVRLQDLATHARTTVATDELEDRVATYGAVLLTCAGCHAKR